MIDEIRRELVPFNELFSWAYWIDFGWMGGRR
jgi:hypothetical protein